MPKKESKYVTILGKWVNETADGKKYIGLQLKPEYYQVMELLKAGKSVNVSQWVNKENRKVNSDYPFESWTVPKELLDGETTSSGKSQEKDDDLDDLFGD